MSWYTSFYIGIQNKDGKIKPLGPYDNEGKLKCVRETSRSFTTDLKDDFYPIEDNMITEELKKEFEWLFQDEDYGCRQYFGYLPLKNLPSSDYIKSGYFLLEDINDYLAYKEGKLDDYDGFYEYLSSAQYAIKLENELKFGKPESKKDCEGYEITQHSCSEYAYFAYPDYESVQYEATLLRTVAYMLRETWDLADGEQIVIIKTEG